MADCSLPEGSLAGTTTLNNGATLILSGKTVNNDTLTIREGDALLQGGALTGNGRVEKSGSGTLTVSNTTLTQKTVNLNEGTLTLNNSTVTTDVIAQRGTALKLTGSTVLNGAIDPTNVILTSGATGISPITPRFSRWWMTSAMPDRFISPPPAQGSSFRQLCR